VRFQREEFWDWPPRRRWRYRRTFDVYQPSGWNSPGAKKAVGIYWKVTIALIKALIAIPLSLLAIGSVWLLWIELQVIYSILSHRLFG
jgi:hypothetical protein